MSHGSSKELYFSARGGPSPRYSRVLLARFTFADCIEERVQTNSTEAIVKAANGAMMVLGLTLPL